jgi:hypothetical protein
MTAVHIAAPFIGEVVIPAQISLMTWITKKIVFYSEVGQFAS